MRSTRRIVWDAITWCFLGTLLVGATVRFIGVLWGLPMTLHADEWVIVEYAIDMAKRNSFEPAFFARPDHLEIQLSYLAYQAFAHLVHGVPPETLFAETQAPFYAISRCITAAFGTAMIPLAYLIGRPVARSAGLFMAIGVAFFPPFVEHSRYATPDIPLTFTVMLVILGCVRYLHTRSWWALVLACAGVALGVTVKYPAALGALAIAATVVIASVRARAGLQILSRGAAAIGMVVVMTFFLSPVLFTNFSEVRRQFTAQNADGHLGASGLGFGGNLAFYAEAMLANGGFLLLAFAAVGIVGWVMRRRWEAVPLALGFVYWIVLSLLSLHWERWGLPMFLSVVLFAGAGVQVAWSFVRAKARLRPVGSWVVGVLAGVSGLTLLAGSVAQAAYALTPDTRVAAVSGLESAGATVENTTYDGYTPFRPDGPGTVARDLTVSDGRVVPIDPESPLRFALTSGNMANRYLADPSLPEGEVYRALIDTVEPVEVWPSAGFPPTGAWEIPRIVQTVSYIARLADGGMVGSTLILYPVGQ